MKSIKPHPGGTVLEGIPPIAAPGALYAVGFHCFGANTPNRALLPALRAVRPRCGCMIGTKEENGRKHSTHQPGRLTQNSWHRPQGGRRELSIYFGTTPNTILNSAAIGDAGIVKRDVSPSHSMRWTLLLSHNEPEHRSNQIPGDETVQLVADRCNPPAIYVARNRRNW